MAKVYELQLDGMSGSVHRNVTIADDEEKFYETTIEHVKELVCGVCGMDARDVDKIRLLFAGKQLESTKGGKVMTIEDYGIENNSTLQFVARVPGGFDEKEPTRREHARATSKIVLSTVEKDVIYGYSEPGDPARVKMSCGHFVDPQHLVDYCRTKLQDNKGRFPCPKCNKPWDYSEIRRAGLLTTEEKQYFEKMLSEHALTHSVDFKRCPRCKMTCERELKDRIITKCSFCSKAGKIFEFCWQCGREWCGDRSTAAVKCGNPKCVSPFAALQHATTITKYGCDFPSIRACPQCGALAEHNAAACKNIICPDCNYKYCFLCLRSQRECQTAKSGSYYSQCDVPVAARQTEIPKRFKQ